jgi:hypothetical protein
MHVDAADGDGRMQRLCRRSSWMTCMCVCVCVFVCIYVCEQNLVCFRLARTGTACQSWADSESMIGRVRLKDHEASAEHWSNISEEPQVVDERQPSRQSRQGTSLCQQWWVVSL